MMILVAGLKVSRVWRRATDAAMDRSAAGRITRHARACPLAPRWEGVHYLPSMQQCPAVELATVVLARARTTSAVDSCTMGERRGYNNRRYYWERRHAGERGHGGAVGMRSDNDERRVRPMDRRADDRRVARRTRGRRPRPRGRFGGSLLQGQDHAALDRLRTGRRV